MRMIITSFRNKRFKKNLMQNPSYLKGDRMKDIDIKKVCEILNEVMECELAGVVRYTHSSMTVSYTHLTLPTTR